MIAMARLDTAIRRPPQTAGDLVYAFRRRFAAELSEVPPYVWATLERVVDEMILDARVWGNKPRPAPRRTRY